MACQAFKPIYWSGKDTPATAAEVKEHNAAWKALCQKKEPAKPAPAKAAGITFEDRWQWPVPAMLTY